MSVELHQSAVEADLYDPVDGVDNVLVDGIWQELDMQLPRERVSRVVCEIALGFQDAGVKIFVPILVHRFALDQLKQELIDSVSPDKHLLDEQS